MRSGSVFHAKNFNRTERGVFPRFSFAQPKFISKFLFYSTSTSPPSNINEIKDNNKEDSEDKYSILKKNLKILNKEKLQQFRDDLHDKIQNLNPEAEDDYLFSNPHFNLTDNFKKRNQAERKFQIFNREKRFLDKIRVRIRPGKGGEGSLSFGEGRTKRYGPPDGGSGGKGGDIIVRAGQAKSLFGILTTVKAGDGTAGSNNLKNGRNGENIYITVPPGTVVKLIDRVVIQPEQPSLVFDPKIRAMVPIEQMEANSNTNSPVTPPAPAKKRDRFKILGELNNIGDEVLVGKGGDGGRGSHSFHWKELAKFKGAEKPDFLKGKTAAEKWIELELKMISDVGLVGYPNAGKSSLLCAVSNATPKVAAYPFTTLKPVLGTVDYADFSQITIADLPGLIDGAHLNRGLGHHFLRHIERTRVLCFVLDMAETNGRSPISDFESLLYELNCYRSDLLSSKKSIIAANKMDLGSLAEENFHKLSKHLIENTERIPEMKIVPISAQIRDNIEELLVELKNLAK